MMVKRKQTFSLRKK